MNHLVRKILFLFLLLGYPYAYSIESGERIIVKKRINRTQDNWYLMPGSHEVFAVTPNGTAVVRVTGSDKVTRDYVVPESSYITTIASYQGISSGTKILLKKKATRETDEWFMHPGIRDIQYVGSDGTLVGNLKCSDGVNRDFLYSPDSYVTLIKEHNGVRAGISSVFVTEKILRGTDDWHLFPGVRKVDFIGSDGTLVSRIDYRDYLIPSSSYLKLVPEYQGIKPDDSVILTKRAPNIVKADDWAMRPGVKTITHVREDGALVSVSTESDGETRHYLMSRDSYIPLVKEFNGIRSGGSVLLHQRANRTEDDWGVSEGVRKVDYVGANGLLVLREKNSDGVTRDYFFPPEIYTPLVKKTPIVEPKPTVPEPKVEELPLTEQRFFVTKSFLFRPWKKKKHYPVLVIKNDGNEAFIVDARHFREALKLRNDLQVFRVPTSKLKVAGAAEEYSEMLQASDTLDVEFPGKSFNRILLNLEELNRNEEDPEKAFAQLHTHLLGTLCKNSLSRVAE